MIYYYLKTSNVETCADNLVSQSHFFKVTEKISVENISKLIIIFLEILTFHFNNNKIINLFIFKHITRNILS